MPHPLVYKLIVIPLDVTGYWLFFGDMDGRVVRHKKDLPNGVELEQVSALRPEIDPLAREFQRLQERLSPSQKNALINLLRQF